MIRRAITRLSEQVTKMWASLLSVCLHVRFPVCDSLENVYRTTNCHITTRLFRFPPHLCTFHLCFYTNRITNLCPWPSSNILNFPSLPLSSLVAALQFLYSEKRVVEETSTVGSANNGHSHLTEANSLLSACFFHKLLLPFSPPPLLCLSPTIHPLAFTSFRSYIHFLLCPVCRHCAPFGWKGMVDFVGEEA